MAGKKSKHKKKSKVSVFTRRKTAIIYHRSVLIIKISILIIACLFLFTNLFFGVKKILRDNATQIASEYGLNYKHLRVEGQVNVPLEDIAESISSKENIPIFSIDLAAVKARLDSHAWINDSVIQRRLPDTIFISLFERKPLAVWQFNKKSYIIDAEGDRITNENIDKFPALIRVIGEGANINAMKLINDLELYPDLGRRVVIATRFGDRRWDIVFDEDITVKMPEEGFDQAYEYLHKLHKKSKLFGQNYKMFDLRVKGRYSFEKNS